MKRTLMTGAAMAALASSFTLVCSASPEGDAPLVDSLDTAEPSTAPAAPSAVPGPLEPLRPSAGLVRTLLSAADRAEIETGRLAVEQARSQEVRAFARKMIEDHARLQRDVESALGDATGAAATLPSAHPLVANLEEDAVEAMEQLRQVASSRDFDATYVVSQLGMHAELLGLLEEMLRNAGPETPPSLESLVSTARATVARHLTSAAELHLSMQPPLIAH